MSMIGLIFGVTMKGRKHRA